MLPHIYYALMGVSFTLFTVASWLRHRRLHRLYDQIGRFLGILAVSAATILTFAMQPQHLRAMTGLFVFLVLSSIFSIFMAYRKLTVEIALLRQPTLSSQ